MRRKLLQNRIVEVRNVPVSLVTNLKKTARAYAGTVSLIVLAVALFELATDVTGLLEPVLFPGFIRIIPAFGAAFPQLLEGLVSSFGLLLPSYLLALILGISLGLFIGYRPGLKKMLMPIFRGISPIPPTMLIPYAISILPTFWLSSAFII